MCGRGGVAYKPDTLEALSYWLSDKVPPTLREAYEKSKVSNEIKPTDRMVVFFERDGEIRTTSGSWTLVPPWLQREVRWVTGKTGNPAMRLERGGKVHFNSRIDTLTGSIGWQRLLKSNRCIVFLSHYFEWSDEEMLNLNQMKFAGKFWVKNQEAFPVACIYSYIMGPGRIPLLTFSIITTEPNEKMKALPHHRMPAILDKDRARQWLARDKESPEALLLPFPDEKMEEQTEAANEFYKLVEGG